ncbi:DUF2057 domain-containing protein [Enterobacteriaceae bacterium H20N1]|uniref:DUF2057 domain-containing protein n=1 Tax=Dryocola boscaweniae TaxID=2925397 RepID=A0A9X2W8E8_9ENTR|nr:DUF2057 family protein [Dryocola boscaweniae]MCT4702879.1 DUF2057 domain-containing protein [Dryocola boscaweniae]MCT4720047.1 DUF2057 domain-containing protein [Dryocola boscaweniae]
MFRTMLTLLLLTLSGFSVASTLKMGENVNVLAARDAQINPLAKSITLGAGEQAMIVRFDAPTNPGSANESQGRITSDALLLTFDAPLTGEVTLRTATPRTENATRKTAKNPQFTLSNADGAEIVLNSQPVNLPQSTLMTDYSQYLPAKAAGTAQHEPRIESKAPAGHNASLSQVQSEFLKLDAAQRKAFLRWALEL